ncbi:MAG: hypothetical protein LBB94_07750 [Clostridiales bacterium]|nr:hypothetical protein [Clostridiales bacterium]
MGYKVHRIILFGVLVGLLTRCIQVNKIKEADFNPQEGVFIEADIKEQPIFDNHEIMIKAVFLDMNALAGPTLTFYGENLTDRDRLVTLKNCSVNNIMIEPAFEMRLNPMGTMTAEAIFPKQLLLTAGVETFSSISFMLHIAEAADRDKYIDSYHFNMLTSMSGSYEQKHEFTGSLIADTNGVKIMIGRKTDLETTLGNQIYIYIDNSLSEDIVVETKKVCVNGIELEPLFISTVGAGKKCWALLTFRDSEIVEHGIVNISELTISFRVLYIFGVIIDTDDNRFIFDNEENSNTLSKHGTEFQTTAVSLSGA